MRLGGLRAGVALADREFAVAVVRRRGGARPTLIQCSLHGASNTSVDSLLPKVIHNRHLARVAMSAVIGAEDYHLVQVEAPDVQPSEIREAVRWRLQDVIDFPAEEATLDVFQVPETPRRGNTKMLFVVAARSATVNHLDKALASQARGFDVIDIPELCLRNLSALLPQDEKGVAFLMLGEKTGQLVLTRQNVLYLARRIELVRRSTLNLSDVGASADIDTDAVALELQRSLDYYESHYDLTQIGELVLGPDDDRTRALADSLRTETGLGVSIFNCHELLDVADGVSVPAGSLSLTTIGAALRTDAGQG